MSRESECVGKKKHNSHRAAQSACKRKNASDRYDKWLRPYSCSYCPFWHLTTKPVELYKDENGKDIKKYLPEVNRRDRP